jgi:hypothetical protein
MKGLDNWITGANDPSAPFNQVDLDDKHGHILEKCDWLTDEMYEEDYQVLCEAMETVIDEHVPNNLTYDQLHSRSWERDNAEFLAEHLLLKYEEIKS